MLYNIYIYTGESIRPGVCYIQGRVLDLVCVIYRGVVLDLVCYIIYIRGRVLDLVCVIYRGEY